MKGKTALLIGLSLIGAYVVYHFAHQWYLLKQYTYKLSGLKVSNVSTTSVTVNTNIVIANPSDVNVDIDGYNLNVFINGIAASTLTSANRMLVAANSSTSIPLTIAFNPTSIAKQTLNLDFLKTILNKSANFQIQGTVSIAINGLKIKDIVVDETVPLNF